MKNRGNGLEIVTHLINSAYSLLQGGDYIEAQSVLLRALDHQSEIRDPLALEWILLSLARTWEETEEYKKWTDFFSDLIRRNPNSSIAYHLRAESHWYAGNPEEALTDYSQAVTLRPDDAGASLGRGQVFNELGDFRRALKDLDRAMALMNSVPYADDAWKRDFEAFARNGRGAAYAGLGDLFHATREFDTSISLCPENAWVYFNRAKVHQSQGDQKKAVADYRLALEKKGPKLNSTKRTYAKAQVEALEA
jgi:tetratricopeptide (TPR) repeat protein